jgi:hypothetical protein
MISFVQERDIGHGKVVGRQLITAGVSYTLLPCLPQFFFCSVKYKQEETVEHQQTKELSREHKICCSNEVVLDHYDCFGCINMMYQQQITVKMG